MNKLTFEYKEFIEKILKMDTVSFPFLTYEKLEELIGESYIRIEDDYEMKHSKHLGFLYVNFKDGIYQMAIDRRIGKEYVIIEGHQVKKVDTNMARLMMKESEFYKKKAEKIDLICELFKIKLLLEKEI